jgi:HEAT repeat protein
VQVFRDALKARQYGTVASCAEAVGVWGHDPGEPLCIQGLEDDKAPDNVRATCATALGMFDTPGALKVLIKIARDDARAALARQCIDLLVLKGEEGIKAVGAILADSSATERSRVDAAAAFAKAKGPEAIPPLLAALNNEHKKYPFKVQGAAAASLGPLSTFKPELLTALVAQMNNPKNDGYLRNACMAAMGTCKNPKVAIPLLIAAMGDREVDNRKFSSMSAYQFLVQLSGERNLGQYQNEWQKWWERNKDRFKETP